MGKGNGYNRAYAANANSKPYECGLCGYFIRFVSFSYKLVKMLSVWMCVWMLTRVELLVTAAHKDL